MHANVSLFDVCETMKSRALVPQIMLELKCLCVCVVCDERKKNL